MPMLNGMIGPGGQLYADPRPNPDETTFQINNTSAAYYNSPYYLLHKSQVQEIPPRRMNAAPLTLSDFVSSDIIDAIGAQGKIVFHSVGDTGAAKVNRSQTPAVALEQEAKVADAMSGDVETGGDLAPAFFFHLGDVIYNFGEAQYYYDQFYEPFREYDRPIFAIPGNHDGMIFGQGSSAPQVPTLDAFLTNFCAAAPGPSPDAGNLVRSVMTQPGVYFTLDAPYVSIIGLYSNVLEGPGVISSQGGHFPIGDDQLTFLQDELSRLKPQRDKGQRAVIIAVHHPPLSADARHAGSIGIEKDLDKACKSANLWPDAVLSGHAHLYQRFTRVTEGKQTPYIVSGSGGFAATKPQGTVPPAPYSVGDHTLEIDPIVEFGYLTVTTDAQTLSFSFKTATVGGVMERDAVTVNLKTGTIVSAGSGINAKAVATHTGTSRKTKGKKPKSAHKKR